MKKLHKRTYYPSNGLFLAFITLIIVEVVLFKLIESTFFYLLIIPLVHFVYLYRNYKIDISSTEISLHTFTKKTMHIGLNEIESISLENSRIRQNIFGPTQYMLIGLKNNEYIFDIYRFEIELIFLELDKYKDDFNYELKQ